MSQSYLPPYEIHVHGDVTLRDDVSLAQVQDALKPMWSYAGASSLAKGAASAYDEEPGIAFDASEHVLHICWTVAADDDFRNCLDEVCMNLNELAGSGAALEVSIYDREFDDEDEDSDVPARDDFLMFFVGPTPGDIMQVQREMLVEDVVLLMERHFEKDEMGAVVAEIDKMFAKRFDAMVNSLQIPRTLRPAPSGHASSGRKPRHLH